jgi:hypothetical protein
VRRGDDPNQSITAQVSVRNFTLRPPLACTEQECGTVQFTLRGREWSVETAQRFTSIATLELPDGDYEIEAALLDTFGKPYKSKDDKKPKCTTCTRWFRLDPTCGEIDPEPEPTSEAPDAGPTRVDAGSDRGPDAGGVSDGGTRADGGMTDEAGPRDGGSEPEPTDGGRMAPTPDAGPTDAGSSQGGNVGDDPGSSDASEPAPPPDAGLDGG